MGTFHVSLAHLLLQMLLQTSFVGKLPGAVGALQRAVQAVVRRLHVVVEEPFLGEVLVAVFTDERSFPGVDPVVDVQMGFSGVSLLTNAAYKWFLA